MNIKDAEKIFADSVRNKVILTNEGNRFYGNIAFHFQKGVLIHSSKNETKKYQSIESYDNNKSKGKDENV